MEKVVVNGVYRHFKGNLYRVIGIAKHSETLEELVVYRALSSDGALWVRPLAMFTGKTENGTERFCYVGEGDISFESEKKTAWNA